MSQGGYVGEASDGGSESKLNMEDTGRPAGLGGPPVGQGLKGRGGPQSGRVSPSQIVTPTTDLRTKSSTHGFQKLPRIVAKDRPRTPGTARGGTAEMAALAAKQASLEQMVSWAAVVWRWGWGRASRKKGEARARTHAAVGMSANVQSVHAHAHARKAPS